MSLNTPPIFEAHFAVPGVRAVLNTLNTRLGRGERGGRETGREGEEEEWKWMRPGFQGIGHAWQWGGRPEGREGGREGEGGRCVPKSPKEEAAQNSKSRWYCSRAL